MITVRKAEVSDLSVITSIYNWAVENTTATFDINKQTEEQRKEWFDKHTGKHPLIVALSDGEVAGYCSLSLFREKEAYKRTAEVSVYVHPSYQKKGIGTILLSDIIERGKKLGYHAIIAGITSDNDVSMRMHQKAGFKKCGHLNEVGFKFGKWLDVVFYELLLEVV
jgi:phosphinothricin acetyltransferase